ncbi:hypothetical protein [Flavobacterium sp. 3HN19-14]|uniref:hypothetical protein n=1 Tax=Flavobacterium sp. 3HN19-14 TaxID=3448133 RepID=UPI003EE00CA2
MAGLHDIGPTDETLQVNNIAAAMLAMNSDIYCIQEITNTVANPSIATLVSLLGSDVWEGRIVPGNTDECDQRQAIIYKKAKVQFVSASQLSSGGASQGNSYYYNWTSGRFPALYNLNLLAGNNVIPVAVINIHAKAEDDVAASYTRRLRRFHRTQGDFGRRQLQYKKPYDYWRFQRLSCRNIKYCLCLHGFAI